MMDLSTSRFTCLGVIAVVIVTGLTIATGTATAQAQQPLSLPGAAAPGGDAEKVSTGIVEGSVKTVDPGAGTVHISSEPLGAVGRTLEVTDWTQIQVEGRQATLADIREGAHVRASYESHEGKNFATQIDVMPGSDLKMSAPPAKSP